LSKQVQQEQHAVDLAQEFVNLELGRYQDGIDPYINVLTAQATLLADQQTLISIKVQEMTSAVALIEALGGGWDRSQLPTPKQVTEKPPKPETTIQQ
jgi:outer membrane protein TolC